MEKWINRNTGLPLLAGAFLAVEILLLIDLAVVYWDGALSLTAAALLWLALTAVSCLVFRMKTKCIMKVALAIPALIAVVSAAGFLGWTIFRNGAEYQAVDSGKHQLFGEQKVMLVVPHQDDDLNILGGTLEEYARYGSELYPVFVTNGDFAGLTEIRYQEALEVFDSLGVPAENVTFLGYGDSWKEGGSHLYNAPSGQVMESYIGRTATYGTAAHPAYREGREYTIDNLMEDLKAVILEYRPDVIFCSDYDHHIDHKAVTLVFDKVMGMLLKEHPDYRPVVYKAYAYGTAWEAEPDYYADNILSTKNLYDASYGQKPVVYHWEERIRFPVAAQTLSRSLVGSQAYQRLAIYESQGAQLMAAKVINGDRVAWQRHTASLCLLGEVSVSSGNGALLNDFMLIDNHDLVDEGHLPLDGVWIPEEKDLHRTVTVTLKEPTDLSSIVLYDHPGEEENVRNAVIGFDDGTSVETGALDPAGAATRITVDRKAVTAFTVTLTETEGLQAGLSEIEAFEKEPEPAGRFLKLTDADGNFLYDYCTASDGTAEFRVYFHGSLPELTEENYHIGIGGSAGSAVLENGIIRVSCPAGESFTLNITCSEAGVSDTVFVRNPGKLERMWQELWQGIEETLYSFYSNDMYHKLLIFSTAEKAAYVLRRIL